MPETTLAIDHSAALKEGLLECEDLELYDYFCDKRHFKKGIWCVQVLDDLLLVLNPNHFKVTKHRDGTISVDNIIMHDKWAGTIKKGVIRNL